MNTVDDAQKVLTFCFLRGQAPVNCNWADLELLSIFLLQLQGYSVDTDDQDTSRRQQEAVLYFS